MLTVVNTAPEPAAVQSAFDPTSLPSELQSTGQSILAINSEKGPLLVGFTARNVATLLPPGAPGELNEEQFPAVQVAAIAAKEPYAGLAIDPGSANGYVIPADFLRAGLPQGGSNPMAKALLAHPEISKNPGNAQARQQLVAAVAAGPMYTAVERKSFEETGEYKFPVIPINVKLQPGEAPPPDAESAVIFGTSPAEIVAAFSPDQFVPLPVRLNDVVKSVQQNANIKMIVINPLGPTLQLPITGQVPGADAAEASEELLNEPTPEPGPATEPDGGTREGED